MDATQIAAIVLISAIVGGCIAWLVRGRDVSSLRRDLEKSNGDRDEAFSQRNEAKLAAAKLEARLESDSKAYDDQIRQLQDLKTNLQNELKVMASEALRANSDDFVKRATELFTSQKELTAGEIDKRSKTIAELITPLQQSLTNYDTALKAFDKSRIEDNAALNSTLNEVKLQQAQVKDVTSKLTNALKTSPKTRGRWGEETLRRVMELSGMVEHCDFDTEKHFKGEDESLRPDMIIHLSGGRIIVVDAKAPVSAYIEAIEEDDDEEREILLGKHAYHLRERFKNLSSKSYWERINGSPDCVVMFVPGDNFVSAAFERDPTLFEDAVAGRVLICTPTTFIALAKAISYGWRQQKLAEGAVEISKLAKDLYLRLRSFGGHIDDLGTHLNRAVKKFNDMVGSLENSVFPQARRFSELGVEGTSEEIQEVKQIDTIVRFPQPNRDLLISKKSGEGSET